MQGFGEGGHDVQRGGGAASAQAGGACGAALRRLMQELDDPEYHRCGRCRLRDPEAEQALGESCLELSKPLLELRVESREVQLVQLPEVRPISRIDHIEPFHELVGNIIAKLLIEL